MKPPAESFLKTILFGEALSHKLATVDSHFELSERSDGRGLSEALDALILPGRSEKLAPGLTAGKASSHFPKKNELKNPSDRGRLLHYFANHELLAIETMAFVLLRFPNADPVFRAGVLRTLQDEQRHLQQYLKRMHDFGVELGDFPLNLYFWNTLKQMKDPIDFVTQMSLTFEQANLDFACFYANLFQTEIDDAETGKLLQEVHDDEIKHVAHGMKWFNQWRDSDESEYESYRKLLPYPMTPRRARGNFFFAAQSREASGMSKSFVESIRIAGGSRGKVPNYFFFNPQAELESAMPELPKALKQKVDELAPVMLWLAGEEDVVELPREPELSFLSQVYDFKGALPEIVTRVPEVGKYAAFDQFKPWGFSQSAWKKLASLTAPVRNPPAFSQMLHAEKLFSKLYWKSVLPKYHNYYGWHETFASVIPVIFGEVLIKIAKGTSGRGHLKISREQLDSPEIQAKLAKIKARGDEVVIEPYYPKVCDFSVQYELKPDGKLLEFEPRFFQVDHLFQYQGAILGRAHHLPGFAPSAKLVDQCRDEIRTAHEPIIDHLRENNYTGPFGIDALTFTGDDGTLKINSVIEVNARYTMGRVAQEIERYAQTKKEKQGVFRILTHRELASFQAFSFAELEQVLQAKYQENFVAITPSSAKETWVFAVFDKNAVDDLLRNNEGLR